MLSKRQKMLWKCPRFGAAQLCGCCRLSSVPFPTPHRPQPRTVPSSAVAMGMQFSSSADELQNPLSFLKQSSGFQEGPPGDAALQQRVTFGQQWAAMGSDGQRWLLVFLGEILVQKKVFFGL